MKKSNKQTGGNAVTSSQQAAVNQASCHVTAPMVAAQSDRGCDIVTVSTAGASYAGEEVGDRPCTAASELCAQSCGRVPADDGTPLSSLGRHVAVASKNRFLKYYLCQS